MNPVGIARVGLYTSAGKLDDTWKVVKEGRTTRTKLPKEIAKYVKPEYGHIADVDSESRLVGLAMLAIDQFMDGHTDDLDFPRPTALCIGSTTAGFRDNQAKGLGLKYDTNYLTPGALGEHLAELYDLDEVFQFSQACASSGYAIAAGCDLINQGYAEAVIAGGVDEVLPCVVDAFSECRIYGDECRPFDANRRGLLLGEAAAFVLLVRADLMNRYYRPCFVTGIGLTCDANDMAAPYDIGIARAIEDASAGVEPGFIIAHATGTKAGDKAEASAIVANGFGRTPVASYKGSLGHPQGASGAVGVVLGVMSYHTGTTFPTAGFEHQDLNMPPIYITMASHMMMKPDHVLCLSSGTWGVNSAILIGKHRDDHGVRVQERTGIVAFHPTVEWPALWARKAGRVKATEFGLTVSNSESGKYAIKHQLTGPQITLAYGNPEKMARLQLNAGRAEAMMMLDDTAPGVVDELR